MLITNFSAGELSEELFGRTDLGQYFQGAARLENFDLIPTGGIKKRPGTGKVLSGLKHGRIIPFVVSLDEAYILLFTHEKITVYRAGEWDKPKAEFSSANITPETLYSESEIPLVQHAQNFRMMVLAQKNHPPLQILFYPDSISLSVFGIEFPIKFIHSPDVIVKFEPKDDETYSGGELKTKGRYPGCVTFFNGRIVFASTTTNGQRLFFSRVDDINDFSTYKAYVTETKSYVVLRGSVLKGEAKILLDDPDFPYEGDKVTGLFEKYVVESNYFEPETRLLSGPYIDNTPDSSTQGKIILDVSNKAKGGLGVVSDEIKKELDEKTNAFVEADRPYKEDENTGRKKYDKSVAYFREPSEGMDFYGKGHYVDIYLGVRGFTLYCGLSEKTYSYPISELTAKNYDENPVATRIILKDIILGGILDFYSTYGSRIESVLNLRNTGNAEKFAEMETVVNFWLTFLIPNLKYQNDELNAGKPYYGFMDNIRDTILAASHWKKTYISLYTTEQAENDYPTADDGFTFELASDRNDEIRWLVQNKNLIAGTESAEYVIPSNINALNISAYLNSFYGTSRFQATSAGDAVLFFRDGNKGLVEYYIPQADNYFRTNDLLMYAKQMLRESEVVDFDLVTSPYTMIVITRADGNLVTLLYDRSLGVFAWSRYSGAGKIKSVAVVPGKSGYDDIYLLSEHGGKYYLELFEYGREIYLDSHIKTSQASWASDIASYGSTSPAVVRVYKDGNGETQYEELPAGGVPDWSKAGDWYIGYPYTAVMRTLPVLANNKMGKQRITSLTFRFLRSFLPKVSSIAGGRNIKTDTITNLETPYSGIHKINFPGTWDEEVQVELTHEAAEPVKILSLNAEVQ